MPKIHDTAIIHEGATLADDVVIGPYCVVGEHVTLGAGVELKSHIVVEGHTTIGEQTIVYPFTVLGSQPQDLKFKGEITTLDIGSNNTIREYVTMNPGTAGGGGKTVVGNNGLYMVGVHIGHDCIVGDYVILANNATLAGHVTLEDHVKIGGLSAVHQFVRIGQHAMIGGMSGIEADVIPYASAMGERANLAGLNLIGLKRSDMARDDIHALRGAYRMLFAPEGTIEERLNDVIEHFEGNERVTDIVRFMQEDTSRSLCQPKSRN